jgi:hypothetical protein
VHDQQNIFSQGMVYTNFGSAMGKILDTLERSQNRP